MFFCGQSGSLPTINLILIDPGMQGCRADTEFNSGISNGLTRTNSGDSSPAKFNGIGFWYLHSLSEEGPSSVNQARKTYGTPGATGATGAASLTGPAGP